MPGEPITQVTVWIALSCYAFSVSVFLLSDGRRSWDSIARISWTIGCMSLIAHVVAAFHYYHQWSYNSALVETARLTSEVYGWYWAGGLYINFLVLAVWSADVLWWWRGFETYRQRSSIFSRSLHIFLWFIFFNATVVFESGLLRWLGILFTISIVLIWLYMSIQHAGHNREKLNGYNQS